MVLLAFSVEDQVEKYGAYVGIAAFFGLAILTLLYFAQAREVKRLREWAGRPGVDPAWVEYVFDKVGLLVAEGDAAALAAAVAELSTGRTAMVETSAEPSGGTAS